MKNILSVLLIFFLFGCSNPASHTAKDIGNKVKECCTSLSLPKDQQKITLIPTVKEDDEPFSAFPMSVFERTEQILTW